MVGRFATLAAGLIPAVLAAPDGGCSSAADCYGLGDCVGGTCRCDPWASAAPDCSVFSTLPIDFPAGYRNTSQPSWGGSWAVQGGVGYGVLGVMTPGYANRTRDYGDPEIALVRSQTPGLGGPFEVAGPPIPNQFQAQLHPHPAGGWVLFSAVRRGPSGLAAAYIADLEELGGVELQQVLSFPAVDPAHPWICHTNDWGATLLPDGSVLAMFRNGGRHCPEGSYPGWPDEQLGLVRASCWNCTDYTVITASPLFRGLPSGGSNEDGFLWWSHRGLHMVLHSQDRSDPGVPHQVRGTVAFSNDTTGFAPASWIISPRPAYNQTISLRNGSALTALRRQRPQLVFGAAEAGAGAGWPKRAVTHLANCVDLDYGLNANGWGDAWALLQPLRQA